MWVPSAKSSVELKRLGAGLLVRLGEGRRAWTKSTWSFRHWTLSRIVRWSLRLAAHGQKEKRLVAQQRPAEAWGEAVRIP